MIMLLDLWIFYKYTSAWNIRLASRKHDNCNGELIKYRSFSAIVSRKVQLLSVLYIYEIMRTCRLILAWLIVKCKLPGFRESASLVKSLVVQFTIKMSKSMVAGVFNDFRGCMKTDLLRCRESNQINYQHDIRIKKITILHTTTRLLF